MRYVRYTAYVCMFGRRGKGAEIPLMGVRFFEIAIRACLPIKRPNTKPRDPWVLPIATKNHVSCGSVGVWRGILRGFQSRFALGSLGENTQPHK